MRRREGKGQHAAHSRFGRERSKVEPAQVPAEVVGVEDETVGDGVETGTFTGRVLDTVDFDDDRVSVHRCGHRVSFNQKEARVVTAFDRRDGQLDHTGQGGSDTARREQGPRG